MAECICSDIIGIFADECTGVVVPATWITADGSDVTEDFIRYARPLIQGEVTVPTEDGVPKFAYRK